MTAPIPKPLQLAAVLDGYTPLDPGNWPCKEAAAELRRLHCRILDLEVRAHFAQVRCDMLFTAKNYWAEKARALEAAQAHGTPLTDSQISEMHETLMLNPRSANIWNFARAIERAHGITQEKP